MFLTDLFSVKSMKSETSSSLTTLLKDIESPIESLRSLGRSSEDMWSDVIVYQITNRFDANTLKD